MFNFLIKLLGGYTKDERHREVRAYEHRLSALYERLVQARKNDTPRDPKTGRLVKKGGA